jgi:hypothetical protein
MGTNLVKKKKFSPEMDCALLLSITAGPCRGLRPAASKLENHCERRKAVGQWLLHSARAKPKFPNSRAWRSLLNPFPRAEPLSQISHLPPSPPFLRPVLPFDPRVSRRISSAAAAAAVQRATSGRPQPRLQSAAALNRGTAIGPQLIRPEPDLTANNPPPPSTKLVAVRCTPESSRHGWCHGGGRRVSGPFLCFGCLACVVRLFRKQSSGFLVDVCLML